MHPGWVNVLSVGTDKEAGSFYYVMEAADDLETGQEIDGNRYSPKSLATVLREKERLAIRDCLELGVCIADALHALHERNLIHRDVKPSNIIYVHQKAKLADIGLVAAINPDGSFFGTPGYMPKEGLGTPSADIFALGRLLYHALTGCPPDNHPSPPTFLGKMKETRDFMRLMTIIDKACEYQIHDRYQTAADLKADLEKLLARLPAKRT
jgi:serine/threonine protein kinase